MDVSSWIAFVTGLLVLVFAVHAGGRVFGRLAKKRRDLAAWRRDLCAEEILRAEGYELLGRREPIMRSLVIGGRAYHYRLYARFVVRKNGLRYVACASSPSKFASDRARRRQLLESLLTLGCDGALIVDVSTDTIDTVDFGMTQASPSVMLAA